MSQMWMVATSKGSKESTLGDLKSRLGDVVQFNVPDGEASLKFGSFDDLIRLTDDIAKMDSQVEAIVRRIERSYYEVDPSKADDPAREFKIMTGATTQTFEQYMKNWQWDDAKYPKNRGLQNNLTSLVANAGKLDEEARLKANGFNELKSAVSNDSKKQTGNLASRDLTQVLIPGVVKEGDFVQTEHITTLVVILPAAAVPGFLATYESYSENVVPGSAKPFEGVSEEGSDTQVWRVVLFKNAVEAFMKKSREERVATVRAFEYSAELYQKTVSQRAELQKACEQQEKVMKQFSKAAFSDAMVAWVHLKAMRVFVESVLRFGIPPNFGAYIVTPPDSKLEASRKVLADALGGGGADAGADDEEDYYPYVSVTFNPFSAKAQS